MDDKTKPVETPEEREKLLAQYPPKDRKLIEDVMAQHPSLTAAEAIEALDAAGGL